MSHLILLQTLQQAAGFDQADENRLPAIQKLLMAGQPAVSNLLTRHLAPNPAAETTGYNDPTRQRAMQKVLNAWTRHAFLPPCDELYAQRRWLLGLTGLKTGLSPQAMAAVLEALHAFLVAGLAAEADRLPEKSTGPYRETLLKSLNVDLAFIGQCYSRNQAIAIGQAVASANELNQAFAARSGLSNPKSKIVNLKSK